MKFPLTVLRRHQLICYSEQIGAQIPTVKRFKPPPCQGHRLHDHGHTVARLPTRGVRLIIDPDCAFFTSVILVIARGLPTYGFMPHIPQQALALPFAPSVCFKEIKSIKCIGSCQDYNSFFPGLPPVFPSAQVSTRFSTRLETAPTTPTVTNLLLPQHILMIYDKQGLPTQP